MEKFKIEIDGKKIQEVINEELIGFVKSNMEEQMGEIEKSVEDYFRHSFLSNKKTQFDSALDWAVEAAFRDAINTAMDELNFKELIAAKAKELLQDDDLIKELAEAKVRSSLGLTNK